MTLQTITTQQTMSSREIAELTGKRHWIAGEWAKHKLSLVEAVA